jgi:transketolase
MTAALQQTDSKLVELTIQTIRFLTTDAVQKAKCGHPGMPMGMAPAAYLLWRKFMKHNPANPRWLNRDRFVLSAGHGSMLLYSLLHLCGYGMTLEDLKNFRQLNSKTPGHPEYHPERGIEVTTGPLGQGISNAVGMAIAQKHLADYFNRVGSAIIDYKIYVIASDGDLEEGVGSESCSLAGHLCLDNLVVIYDDNHISIDGDTKLSFTEDTAARFKAYGWNVIVVDGDGNDLVAIEKAIKRAQRYKGKPSIIKLRTHIAYGAPHAQDTAAAHGAALGEEEVRLTKQRFGWDPEKTFYIPDEVAEDMLKVRDAGTRAEKNWQRKFNKYAKEFPELARRLKDALEGKLSIDVDSLLPKFSLDKPLATRRASGAILSAIMPKLPMIMGGSADLTPSNNTRFEGVTDFQKDNRQGRYIRYGVREHAMCAIMNGISVSRPCRAYGGTFFVFSDYARAAIRVAAMSRYPTIFVFTHDSIGLGEDGPTHQPVEHIPSLRAMPNMLVIRPADANETAQAWKFILNYHDGPVALLLTRQGQPVLDQEKYPSAVNLVKGAYAIKPAENPDLLLLATGSEVHVALAAAEALEAQGVKTQVVSMPSWELFEQQPKEYRDSVIPPQVKSRIGVEAAVGLGWERYLGEKGIFIGIETFGVSAPYKDAFAYFGITPDNVVATAKKLLG